MLPRLAIPLVCLILFLQPTTIHAETQIQITSNVIRNLDLRDSNRSAFGSFNFVGGLILRSNNPNFGGVSALHVGDTGVLTAITDTGLWVSSQIDRYELERPSALSKTIIAPLLNTNGLPFENKWQADAEGLAVGPNKVFVSLEQDSRIISYPLSSKQFNQSSQLVLGTEFAKTLRTNFALEAIAAAPTEAKLPFDLVAISEFSPNAKGHARAFFRQSDTWHEFQIPLQDSYLITDAAFGSSGDLLVLERRYSLSTGARARIRQIASGQISAGNLATGKIILELNQDQLIDNMEGIAVFKTPDGKRRMALMSDNNLFPLQRTLYLEFEWLDKQ